MGKDDKITDTTSSLDSGSDNVKETPPVVTPTVSNISLSARDFCDSKAGLKYKNRVLYILERKYPKATKLVSEWEEILVKDEVV